MLDHTQVYSWVFEVKKPQRTICFSWNMHVFKFSTTGVCCVVRWGFLLFSSISPSSQHFHHKTSYYVQVCTYTTLNPLLLTWYMIGHVLWKWKIVIFWTKNLTKTNSKLRTSNLTPLLYLLFSCSLLNI